jgi:hypothetical protein
METKFRIVETEDYVLAVSDGEIKKDDYFYYTWFNADIIQKADSGSNLNNLNAKNPKDNFKKIIAYKPKGNAPELDLPLLPDVEPRGFDEFEYTEEDLRRAINMARGIKEGKETFTAEDISGSTEVCTYGWKFEFDKDEIIQSLKQPKWFVAEMKHTKSEVFRENDNVPYAVLKTTTINNKTYLVGTYLN